MALRICNQVSWIKDFDPECNICNIHVMNNEGHYTQDMFALCTLEHVSVTVCYIHYHNMFEK